MYALPLQLFVVQLLWLSVGGLHGRLTLQSPLHLRRPIRDMNHACSALSHRLPCCASCVACVPQDAGGALWCAVSWVQWCSQGLFCAFSCCRHGASNGTGVSSQGAEAAVPFRQRGGDYCCLLIRVGGGCRMMCEQGLCGRGLLRSMYLLVCIWLMEGMVSRGPGVWYRGRKGGIHGAPFVL
jgi:hypothetical protein